MQEMFKFFLSWWQQVYQTESDGKFSIAIEIHFGTFFAIYAPSLDFSHFLYGKTVVTETEMKISPAKSQIAIKHTIECNPFYSKQN